MNILRTAVVGSVCVLACGDTEALPELIGARTLDIRATSSSDRAERLEQVEKYLRDKYFSRFTVLATTTNAFGQTIDWVDPEELDPDYHKYPLESPPALEEQLTSKIEPPIHEEYDVEEDSNSRGPEGLSGIVRPEFGYYVDGKSTSNSVEDFLVSLAQPQPAGQDRLYTGWRYGTLAGDTLNMGTRGFLTVWNYGDVPGNGFSLTQANAWCGPAASYEAIEFGFHKYPAKYNDSNVHIFGFFRTNGASVGNRIGGYNTDFVGFVPAAGATKLGSVYSGSFSSVGGNQYARGLSIYKSTTQPRWYLAYYNSAGVGEVLGYYPIGSASPNINFNIIQDAACRVDWYSEVYDPTPTQWDATNAGSGNFPGGTTPAYIRQLRVFAAPTQTAFHFPTGSGVTAFNTVDPGCYNMDNVQSVGNTTFDPYFYYGGPGNDLGGAAGRPCD